MNISIVGTGYVGLVTGTCFAEMGHEVICVDIDEKKVSEMKNGNIPIYEPKLEHLFERNTQQARLTFTTDLANAVGKSDVIFLALPTPSDEDGSANLSYIIDVANKLGALINTYKIIVNKSTVPVGTAQKVREAIEKNSTSSFDVVSNPEFLREGFAVDDFLQPERVVIGSTSQKAKDIMTELYKPFVQDQNTQIHHMDEKSAELTKYAANAFLATKITFMNEIANFCEKVGADVDLVRQGIGSDSRIGHKFLYPGIGYGGSCFPKDVKALVNSGKEHDHHFAIIDTVERINQAQKLILVEKIIAKYGDDLSNKTFALWGLSFKPDTDDIRDAPSLTILKALTELGAHIQVFDPEAMRALQNHVDDKTRPNITFCENQYAALENADALLIATEWPLFQTPDFEKMESLLRTKTIFDGRNLFECEKMRKLGYYYESIGRERIEQN